MNKYVYEGSVRIFDNLVADNWKAETFAVSEKKATSNIIFQYKKSHNLSARTKVTLIGKVKMV